jgi:hypothetical protein
MKLKFIYILTGIASILFISMASCKKDNKSNEIEGQVIVDNFIRTTQTQNTKIKNLINLRKKNGFINNGKVNECYECPDETISTLLTEEEAITLVTPTITPTISYVQYKYGINLLDYFGQNDPNIAMVGYALLRLEQLESQEMTLDTTVSDGSIQVSSIGLKSSNLIVMEDQPQPPNLYDCALRSVGIEAIIKLFESGITLSAKALLTNKALRKVIIKVSSRTLGFVGAAVAIYQFGDCMQWY